MGSRGFLLLVAGYGVCQCAAQAPILTWWVSDSLIKIKPQDSAPHEAHKSAYLYAGRNEFEPFQIILRPEAEDVWGADVDCSDLLSSGGGLISHDHITFYLEEFVNLTQPSSTEGGTGLWPDPLVPRVDRYANERRNAFPFTVLRGHAQPLWVEVFVPPETRPGEYSGAARVTRKGAVEVTVPIHLRVWAFVLPSTSSLKSSFGLNGTTALKQHYGSYTRDADLYALTRLYAKAALMHRISVHGGSMSPPKYRYEGGHMDLDWHAYDAEMGPLLDGTAISEGQPLHGARETTLELSTPQVFESSGQQAAYWAACFQYLQRKHWDAHLFFYLWDEPREEDMPKVIERGRAALQAVPTLRTLVTVPFHETLRDVVKIWVSLVNCLMPKPGYDDYCHDSPPFESYRAEIAQGKSLWFYQSCASHGCNGPGGSYFTGWPSYMIDATPLANRIMQWIAWRCGIEGELYYSMNEAYASGKDPWTNIRVSGGNGDGTLFYPGRPGRIGGHTDIPIETIRLKLIREGMEDYEYLVLLAKLAGEKAAREYADRIVTAPYRWESRPEVFTKVRQEMGEKLDRLARARLASASDAQ
jgi:hypothetical protein